MSCHKKFLHCALKSKLVHTGRSVHNKFNKRRRSIKLCVFFKVASEGEK